MKWTPSLFGVKKFQFLSPLALFSRVSLLVEIKLVMKTFFKKLGNNVSSYGKGKINLLFNFFPTVAVAARCGATATPQKQ